MSTSIETLRAVHHPVRRRMIDYLHLNGPSQVGTLAAELDQQVGSISHHLRMLQRVGIVEQAPELASDGRTSWWRIRESSLSWSVEDFDLPAERMQAKSAERVNIDYQLRKLAAWKSSSDAAPPAWRRAAFSTDFSTTATAAELEELGQAVARLVDEWAAAIDREDGQAREPVFFFGYGFRTRP